MAMVWNVRPRRASTNGHEYLEQAKVVLDRTVEREAEARERQAQRRGQVVEAVMGASYDTARVQQRVAELRQARKTNHFTDRMRILFQEGQTP